MWATGFFFPWGNLWWGGVGGLIAVVNLQWLEVRTYVRKSTPSELHDMIFDIYYNT